MLVAKLNLALIERTWQLPLGNILCAQSIQQGPDFDCHIVWTWKYLAFVGKNLVDTFLMSISAMESIAKLTCGTVIDVDLITQRPRNQLGPVSLNRANHAHWKHHLLSTFTRGNVPIADCLIIWTSHNFVVIKLDTWNIRVVPLQLMDASASSKVPYSCSTITWTTDEYICSSSSNHTRSSTTTA